jgi:hypothetical protein
MCEKATKQSRHVLDESREIASTCEEHAGLAMTRRWSEEHAGLAMTRIRSEEHAGLAMTRIRSEERAGLAMTNRTFYIKRSIDQVC